MKKRIKISQCIINMADGSFIWAERGMEFTILHYTGYVMKIRITNLFQRKIRYDLIEYKNRYDYIEPTQEGKFYLHILK